MGVEGWQIILVCIITPKKMTMATLEFNSYASGTKCFVREKMLENYYLIMGWNEKEKWELNLYLNIIAGDKLQNSKKENLSIDEYYKEIEKAVTITNIFCGWIAIKNSCLVYIAIFQWIIEFQ